MFSTKPKRGTTQRYKIRYAKSTNNVEIIKLFLDLAKETKASQIHIRLVLF
jgi:hypothetical protein